MEWVVVSKGEPSIPDTELEGSELEASRSWHNDAGWSSVKCIRWKSSPPRSVGDFRDVLLGWESSVRWQGHRCFKSSWNIAQPLATPCITTEFVLLMIWGRREHQGTNYQLGRILMQRLSRTIAELDWSQEDVEIEMMLIFRFESLNGESANVSRMVLKRTWWVTKFHDIWFGTCRKHSWSHSLDTNIILIVVLIKQSIPYEADLDKARRSRVIFSMD